MSPYDPLGAVVPIAHPHYCVHGQQIGWHLAVDPQTVIDHVFCAPCKRCEEGIPPERTSVLPAFTGRELRELGVALTQRIDRLKDTMRDPMGKTPHRMDMLTVAMSLLTAVSEAQSVIGDTDE